MRGHVAGTTLDDISTCSENMQRLIAQARRYAMTNSTVLITGETRNRKGNARTGHSHRKSAEKRPVCRNQLCVYSGKSSGKQALWL